MRTGSRFTIDPNPPVAGAPATVTYHGDSGEVTLSVPGHFVRDHKVPPNQVVIDPVPDGTHLLASDNKGETEGTARWPIDQLSGGRGGR